MTEDRDVSRHRDDERIDIHDEADVTRWAEELCTSPQDLLAAIKVVGADVFSVKGHLFTQLVRRQNQRGKPGDP